MSELETQVEYSDVGTPDIPELTASDSPELDNLKTIQAAYLDNYNSGTSVIESFYAHAGSMDKDAVVTQLAAEKKAKDEQAITDYLKTLLDTDPEVFVESVEAASDIVAETREHPVVDPTTEFVDAIAGVDATDEQKKATRSYVKMYEVITDAMKEYGAGDIALDFASEITPFVSTAKEASLTGNIFGNEEAMQRAVYNFKSLPFEEQEEMYPLLVSEVLDKLGPIKGFPALEQFIKPTNDQEFGDFSNWWKVIDAVDLTSAGAAFVMAARAFKSSVNIPKILNKAGNIEEASNANTVALADREAAQKMNIQQDTAVSNSLAFDVSITDPAYTTGLSAKTVENVEGFFAQADKTVDDIIAGNGYLKEGILNTVERAVREKAAYEKLMKAKHEEIQIVGRTENTTKFKYKARDEDGNYFSDDFELDLTLDDVGQYDQSEIMTMSEFINSPTVFAKGLTRLDVNTAQRLDDQTAKVFRELTTLQSEAVKDLGSLLRPKNRQRLAGVERALREGDEFKNVDGTRGKVFTPDELRGTYHLDDAQMSAYYKTNRLYNNLWRLRNNSKREEMIAFKYKQVDMLDGEYSFGKPHETANDAFNSLKNGNISKVFDKVRDEVVVVTDRNFVDEQYALGKVLVKLPEAYNSGAGRGKYSHVFVNPEDVRDLPSVVLNRKVGYVPKISQDGHWFVKEFADDVVDGKETTTVARTLRYFDNKADADAYREQLIVKDMENLNLTRTQAEAKYKNLEDREQEIISTATGKFSNGSGGLYTAARAEDDILFGLNGDLGQRISPYEALVRNISNISRMVPINQWRLGLEQRWINTARELTGEDIGKFGTLPKEIESTRVGEFLNKMASQIRDWQGFPSKEEQVYNSITQRLYEWSLKTGSTRGSKILGWMRDKDPISASRAAAFHSLLGWFNPAQLWVQAQGMSIAVSINLGKNLTETLRHTTGLTVLGQGVEFGTARYKLAAKAAGMSEQELADIHKLWLKSGLEDSILQTADHAAAIRGHGVAMDAISKAADKGLFFYRNGELLNRRMAFTTALDELKSGTLKGFETFKRGDEVSDAALKAVLDRSHNLMLNMSKANRAQWQKGLASIPTQFFQVSAKALETVGGFNDNLTAAERGRVMAGQIALYGFAGIPLANFATSYLMEAMGVTQEDIDNNPLLVKTWNDGFWGFTTLGIFGVDAEVSSRGSLARGVTDFIDNWIFTESDIATKLLGAFGATGQRFWDSFTRQMRPLMFNAYPIDIIDVAKIPTMPFLETVSTWRNGEKAVFMQLMDKIYTSRGDTLVERDFSWRESLAAGIGFQLSDEAKPWSLQERVEHAKNVNKKIADLIVDRMNDAVIKGQAGLWNDKKQLEHEQQIATILSGLDWDQRKSVTEAVRNRISGDSKEVKAIKQYIERVGVDTTDGLSKITALLGTNIQPLNKPEEQE